MSCTVHIIIIRVYNSSVTFTILQLKSDMNRRIELVGTRQLALVEKPIPEVPGQGLLVKVQYAGICHSDMHFWENKVVFSDQLAPSTEETMKKKFPWCVGHEIAGEVYELGTESCEGAPQLNKGDLVIVYPWMSGCNPVCNACRSGHQTFCSSRETNKTFIGCQLDGGWETYVAVPKRWMVIKVPAGLAMDTACLVPCSAITAYNSIMRVHEHVQSVAKHCGNTSVIIHGVGGVGLWAVSIAKAVLPAGVKVFAADIAANKLEAATSAGADGTLLIDPKASDVEVVTSIMTGTGGGVDTIIDFVGLGSAANRLTRCLLKSGMLVLVGLAGGTMPLSAISTVVSRHTITGSLVGDSSHVVEVFKLLEQGKVHPPPIEYCQLEAEAVQSVLIRMEERKLDGRVVIKMP